jgi:hypothetical protein
VVLTKGKNMKNLLKKVKKLVQKYEDGEQQRRQEAIYNAIFYTKKWIKGTASCGGRSLKLTHDMYTRPRIAADVAQYFAKYGFGIDGSTTNGYISITW